jgi:hypothetical protein
VAVESRDRLFSRMPLYVTLLFEAFALLFFLLVDSLARQGELSAVNINWPYYIHPFALLAALLGECYLEADSFYTRNVLFPSVCLAVFGGLQWYFGSYVMIRIIRRVYGSASRGCCPTCGYNLTGNLSGMCPECGTPVLRNRKS